MTNTEETKRSLPRAFRETEVLLHRYMASCRPDHFDPERGQGRILALLQKTGPLAQRDMAYLLGIRPQSLGELVHKLEENGFVVRTSQEDDKRVMIVALTEKGSAVKMPKGPLADVFDCLDEEEQQNLRSYLDKICSRIEELLPEDAADPEEPYGPPCHHGPRGFGPARPYGPGFPDGPHHHHGPHGPRRCGMAVRGWFVPEERDCF